MGIEEVEIADAKNTDPFLVERFGRFPQELRRSLPVNKGKAAGTCVENTDCQSSALSPFFLAFYLNPWLYTTVRAMKSTPAKSSPENELIRLQIDNTDYSLTDEQIHTIITGLSRYTSRISKKYKIPNEKFKLVTGRSMIEKLFRLA
jgi:hypothetical protein